MSPVISCQTFAMVCFMYYPNDLQMHTCRWPLCQNYHSQQHFKMEILLSHFATFPFQTESNLSKEMESFIKDIKNTTQRKYMDYGKNPGSPDNDFLFMYSVAR